MWSWLIELISNFIEITGNSLADTIIFAVIGLISGSIVFGLVGVISNTTGIRDSKVMSEMHWIFRVFLFGFLTFIFVKIAQFLKWIFIPPALYYLIGFFTVITIAIILVKIFKKPKKKMLDETVDIEIENTITLDNNEEIKRKTDLNKCPYCGAALVERNGPYGIFIGCSNYPKCKYTRKK